MPKLKTRPETQIDEIADGVFRQRRSPVCTAARGDGAKLLRALGQRLN